MKKKKINKKMRKKIILIIFLILAILIVKQIISMIFGNSESNEITLLLNNNLIQTKDEIIKEDDVIYLSKEDVGALLDTNMYYNEAEKELITTYNKHIALLKVDEDFMVINDSNAELTSPMIKRNDKIYLPFSEMGIVYDLEFEYSENNKRLIGEDLSKEKKTAITLKNFKLKNKPSLFSTETQKVLQGEYITIIEDASKKYFKIRTSDGNVGYVKKKRVSNPKVVREHWENEKIDVAVIKEASDVSKDYSKATLNKEKQNTVIPTFFFLDKEGEILDKTASATDEYKSYINWTKENNIEIWATLENNIDVSNVLLNYTDRNKVINDLYKKLVDYQFTGININFKKIDDVNSFNRFVIELTPRLKELGIKVAITNNKMVDKDKLSKVVDMIIE